jgi:hypothetical protein
MCDVKVELLEDRSGIYYCSVHDCGWKHDTGGSGCLVAQQLARVAELEAQLTKMREAFATSSSDEERRLREEVERLNIARVAELEEYYRFTVDARCVSCGSPINTERCCCRGDFRVPDGDTGERRWGVIHGESSGWKVNSPLPMKLQEDKCPTCGTNRFHTEVEIDGKPCRFITCPKCEHDEGDTK